MNTTSMRRPLWLVAFLLAFVGIGAAVGWVATRGPDTPSISQVDDDTEFEHDYVIPAGTADRLEAGETVEIVPAELTVRVGEDIRIVNQDDADHAVGVFYVPAGRTLTQHFNSPGVLEGQCDIHPSGNFKLIVEE